MQNLVEYLCRKNIWVSFDWANEMHCFGKCQVKKGKNIIHLVSQHHILCDIHYISTQIVKSNKKSFIMDLQSNETQDVYTCTHTRLPLLIGISINSSRRLSRCSHTQTRHISSMWVPGLSGISFWMGMPIRGDTSVSHSHRIPETPWLVCINLQLQ